MLTGIKGRGGEIDRFTEENAYGMIPVMVQPGSGGGPRIPFLPKLLGLTGEAPPQRLPKVDSLDLGYTPPYNDQSFLGHLAKRRAIVC